MTNEVVSTLHRRIKDLAANSTPDQLAYLAKAFELIVDKKEISNITQITAIKEIIDTLQKRLKDLAATSTPDQLAYLAKTLESIVDKSAVSEIVQMTNGKLKELQSSTNSYLNEINTNKENSISAITTVKTQSVNEINILKTNSLNSLKSSSDSYISLLDTRKNTNIATINSIGIDQTNNLKSLVNNFKSINDVPNGSSIMKEVRTREEQLKSLVKQEVKNRNMVEPGSLPFLFGVLSRKNNYFGHGAFTTELGQWSSDITKTDHMLQLLAGSHTYDTSYVSFYRPRQLCFLEGSKGAFIYGESYTRLIRDSFKNINVIYQYPYAALGVIFVKNTTNMNISKIINFVGSAEGAGLYVGIPDNTNVNKSKISKITWLNIYKHTSDDNEFAASGNVEVPAGKTVAILLYTSSELHSGNSMVGKTPEFDMGDTMYDTIYGQFIQWGIYNFRSNFLTEELEVDVERTLKAWQCPGLEATSKIWN
ncbi:hypothetical protein IC220_07050 [Wolbachia endosymbiont of Pentalonia nigronervosa]|uniref:hypothetical protein n=1 Tax=Wolbachia endosymbiont of Pentalonia nigronervosa TaxID=1301914 RepID=UPI00165F8465|nr:hypothetical protein [Wolbachia endosymbiont of Pentalonia nigronervosa]MBD0392160.1 hypothetical protein [Wolbachia endosymbiont of Pentalonia nigronervosa]